MLELWLKVVLKSENRSTLVHTLCRKMYINVGESPIVGAFLNEGYPLALPMVGNFSFLWRMSNSSSWKKPKFILFGIYIWMELATQLWIQFFKKHGFHLWKSNLVLVNLCATHTKINGLPVVNNGSSQLFREKNVIQIQSWFLKIKKTWFWIQL